MLRFFSWISCISVECRWVSTYHYIALDTHLKLESLHVLYIVYRTFTPLATDDVRPMNALRCLQQFTPVHHEENQDPRTYDWVSAQVDRNLASIVKLRSLQLR